MTTSLITLIQSASEISGADGLSTGGVIFMALSWTIVIGFTFYCFSKVLRSDDKLS